MDEFGYLFGYPEVDGDPFIDELLAWAAGDEEEPEEQQEETGE